MKFHRRLISITLIFMSVLNACDRPPSTSTETPAPSETAVSIASATATNMPSVTDGSRHPEFSFPPMVIAADESRSMTADDHPKQPACDDDDLLRYKLPLFFAQAGNSFIKRNISSADVNMWYMGQNSITISDNNETGLNNRLIATPTPAGGGDAQFKSAFQSFADYLNDHQNARLIMVTDGDLRSNRPESAIVTKTTKDQTQDAFDKIEKGKNPKVYILLLCPDRLDPENSLSFWQDLDEDKDFVQVFYLGWKGPNGEMTTIESILKDVLTDILRDSGWETKRDEEFNYQAGYRNMGWDIVSAKEQESYQFKNIPPNSIRVNYGAVSYGGSNLPFAETLADNQPLNSLHALIDPRSDCRNHTLSFMDQGDLFFYWWLVDIPVFQAKWDEFVITNNDGKLHANLQVLIPKYGSNTGSMSDYEDVTGLVDWANWEKCTKFSFQKGAERNTISTFNGLIDLPSNLPEVLNVERKAEGPAVMGPDDHRFDIDFDITARWSPPTNVAEQLSALNIPLVVISGTEGSLASQDKFYVRYIPELKNKKGIAKKTEDSTEVSLQWEFKYFTEDFYPGWQPHWWEPSIEFVKEDDNEKWVHEENCNAYNLNLSVKDGKLISTIPISDIKNGACKNARLSWTDWPVKEHWQKPKSLICSWEPEQLITNGQSGTIDIKCNDEGQKVGT